MKKIKEIYEDICGEDVVLGVRPAEIEATKRILMSLDDVESWKKIGNDLIDTIMQHGAITIKDFGNIIRKSKNF